MFSPMPRRRVDLFLEELEDRCLLSVTAVPQTFTAAEGVSTPIAVMAFTDTESVGPDNFTNVQINWGDGTTTAGTITQPGGTGAPFLVTGSHAYAVEGPQSISVSMHDTQDNQDVNLTGSTATIPDAPLLPGTASAVPTNVLTGVGTGSAAGSAAAALSSFETAIGGTNNGGTASPQSGGFRTINWDGVPLDGNDPGFSDTVIVPNSVVGIPTNRFQERGVQFAEVYAVSGPNPATPSDNSTFVTVNPNVDGLFPPFSSPKTFAMFNENTIELNIVQPSSHTTTPTPAATSAFGAVFLNVEQPNTSSIEFFDGDQSLGKYYVPIAAPGQPEFLGVQFSSPVITNVTLTLGSGVLFSFDGKTVTSGGANSATNNLVATDDFAYAEPAALASSSTTTLSAAAGVSLNNVLVGQFTDSSPPADASGFTATIDWGDGHTSPGTITSNGNGLFSVNGSNTYANGGTFAVSAVVQDFGGSIVTLTNTANVTGSSSPTPTPTPSPSPTSGPSSELLNQLELNAYFLPQLLTFSGENAALFSFTNAFLLSMNASSSQTNQLMSDEMALAFDLVMVSLDSSRGDEINSLVDSIDNNPAFSTPAGYATGLLSAELAFAALNPAPRS